jgi:ribosomal protein L7/L12
MRDDTLVSEQVLKVALDDAGRCGPEAVLEDLIQSEPHLGSYLQQNATLVAGKLALSGAPQPVIEGVHTNLLSACALVYRALRQGTYEIWQNTALGERLKLLDPASGETRTEDRAGPQQQPDSSTIAEPRTIVLLGVKTGHKTQLSRAVSRLTGWTLRQVRQLLEQTPVTLFENVPAEVAASIQTQLEQSGGRAVVTPVPPAPTDSREN